MSMTVDGETTSYEYNKADQLLRAGETTYQYFASPKGTPFEARALPPDALQKPYLQYEVVKPVDVNSGMAAPWFGQLGMGTQYEFSKSIQQLIDDGVLREVKK